MAKNHIKDIFLKSSKKGFQNDLVRVLVYCTYYNTSYYCPLLAAPCCSQSHAALFGGWLQTECTMTDALVLQDYSEPYTN